VSVSYGGVAVLAGALGGVCSPAAAAVAAATAVAVAAATAAAYIGTTPRMNYISSGDQS
jgi:hypothetical protein